MTKDIGYILSLAGGQRWVCARVDAHGNITDLLLDEFVWGV